MKEKMKTPKTEIMICMGSSCFSRGNNQSLGIIQDYLKQNNLEAEITLTGCLCQDRCQEGPIIQIGGKRFEHVDPTSVIDIIRHTLDEVGP